MHLELYEKYRPRRLPQLVGQDKAVAVVSRHVARFGTVGGSAWWITGKTGQGKTSLARMIAGLIASRDFTVELDAGGLMPGDVDALVDSQQYYGCGAGGRIGRAVIVDESHGLRRDTVRRLLVALEPVRSHVVWVFTTTADGMALFEDCQMDASPLLSRCHVVNLTGQGVAVKLARLVQGIARREGLDGQALPAYVKLANACGGNCRMMLQRVSDGAMLPQ